VKRKIAYEIFFSRKKEKENIPISRRIFETFFKINFIHDNHLTKYTIKKFDLQHSNKNKK